MNLWLTVLVDYLTVLIQQHHHHLGTKIKCKVDTKEEYRRRKSEVELNNKRSERELWINTKNIVNYSRMRVVGVKDVAYTMLAILIMLIGCASSRKLTSIEESIRENPDLSEVIKDLLGVSVCVLRNIIPNRKVHRELVLLA